jgi:hypothetical protein
MVVPVQFIPEGRECDAEGCQKILVRLAYPVSRKVFFHSERCEGRYRSQHGPRVKEVFCGHCGESLGLVAPRPTESGLRFHKGCDSLHRREQMDIADCGPLLPVFRVYEKFAKKHYVADDPRNAIRHFLRFLVLEGVTEINQADVPHIGRFVAAELQTKAVSRAEWVRVFFDCLIEQGIYRNPNPVRPKLHYRERGESEPRTYSRKNLENFQRLANGSGDPQVKLVLAFGEDFGPYNHQVYNMRLSDVKREQRRVWLRDLSGENIVSWARYTDRTERALEAWLAKRPHDCGHEYLLVNMLGDPLRKQSLQKLLHDVCGTGFSLHILRYTNIARLVRGKVDDNANMNFHSLKGAACIRRFERMLTEEEKEQFKQVCARIAAEEARQGAQ